MSEIGKITDENFADAAYYQLNGNIHNFIKICDNLVATDLDKLKMVLDKVLSKPYDYRIFGRRGTNWFIEEYIYIAYGLDKDAWLRYGKWCGKYPLNQRVREIVRYIIDHSTNEYYKFTIGALDAISRFLADQVNWDDVSEQCMDFNHNDIVNLTRNKGLDDVYDYFGDVQFIPMLIARGQF